MNDLELRKQLKNKADWEGVIVRLLRSIENNKGVIFPEGLRMKVRKNYGGLELEYVAACPDCKLHHRQAIKGVPETSVEIISIPNQQGVKYA